MITREKKTELKYIGNAKSLLARANDAGQSLCEYFLANESSWSYSTFRTYKSSLVFYCEQVNKSLDVDLEKIKNAIFTGKKASRLLSEKKLSQLKIKHVSEDVEKKILKILLGQGTLTSQYAALMFSATLVAGLRPIEWIAAKLIKRQTDGKVILRVSNAKNTNNRSHGDYRHLIYDADSPSVQSIMGFLAVLNKVLDKPGNLKSRQDAFDAFYESVRKSIQRAYKKAYPKKMGTVNIYSCRHQFIANLKASGYSAVSIAALVGHATDLTANLHYGKAHHGNGSGSVLPSALDEEMERIRQYDNDFIEKVSSKQNPVMSPNPSQSN